VPGVVEKRNDAFYNYDSRGVRKFALLDYHVGPLGGWEVVHPSVVGGEGMLMAEVRQEM